MKREGDGGGGRESGEEREKQEGEGEKRGLAVGRALTNTLRKLKC